MKLHSAIFEKNLRRAVNQTVRASPELRRERRRLRVSRRVPGFWFRPLWSTFLAVVVLVTADTTNHPLAGLSVIALWVFGLSFLQAQRLWHHLHADADLRALALLPITPAAIFQWELQKFLREIYLVVLDVAVCLSALCWVLHSSVAEWLLILPMAVWSAVICAVLSLLIAARVPRKVYCNIVLGELLVIVVGFFGMRIFGHALLQIIDGHALEINLLLPTGWPLSLFQLACPNPDWTLLCTLLPAMLICWTAGNSLHHLKSGFGPREIIRDEAPDIIPRKKDEPFKLEGEPKHAGLTEIREIIESREFLAPPLWPALGWFEQRLWKWFNPREKQLVEFAFPNGFAITRPWITVYRNLLITIVVGLAAGLLSTVLQAWLVAAGIFITVCQSLYQIQSGDAFHAIVCSGVYIPMYAVFSIGYRELSGMLTKCAAIQLPLFIPFGMVTGVLVTYLLSGPVLWGALIGGKIAVLFFACRYVLLLFAFSSGTNDNNIFSIRTAVMLLILIIGGLIFLALALIAICLPDQLVAWGVVALTVLHGYLIFRIYGWFYHRNYFDLMKFIR